MMKIALSALDNLYSAIAKEYDLYIPVNKKGLVDFAKWEKGSIVDLDTLKTAKSAKDVFFPQSQLQSI